jgi:ferredoxin-NADP reductase
MPHKVKILSISFVTHDVKRFVVEKPAGFEFKPGQAVEVIVDKKGWENKARPFTFTSLNSDLILEFIIKGYTDHKGVTDKLHDLRPGDELILGDVFGTINYKGKGVFIAGGAGITPFIAIFRELKGKGGLSGNKLIFSNKTSRDVILEKELKEYFNPNDLTLILTEENKDGFETRKVNQDLLKEKINDFSQNFYLCGPPPMVADMKKYLKELGVRDDRIIFEK